MDHTKPEHKRFLKDEWQLSKRQIRYTKLLKTIIAFNIFGEINERNCLVGVLAIDSKHVIQLEELGNILSTLHELVGVISELLPLDNVICQTHEPCEYAVQLSPVYMN